MAQSGKRTGKVKWFDSQKGYGFITPDDGTEDLFVHQTSIHSDGFRSLAEGESVEFSVEHEQGGRTKALDVTGPNGVFVQGGSIGGGGGGGFGGGGGGRGGRGGGGGYGGGGYGGGGGGYGGSSGGYGDGGYGGSGGGRGGGGCGGGRGGSGGGGGGSCYNCGDSGHLLATALVAVVEDSQIWERVKYLCRFRVLFLQLAKSFAWLLST